MYYQVSGMEPGPIQMTPSMTETFCAADHPNHAAIPNHTHPPHSHPHPIYPQPTYPLPHSHAHSQPHFNPTVPHPSHHHHSFWPRGSELNTTFSNGGDHHYGYLSTSTRLEEMPGQFASTRSDYDGESGGGGDIDQQPKSGRWSEKRIDRKRTEKRNKREKCSKSSAGKLKYSPNRSREGSAQINS